MLKVNIQDIETGSSNVENPFMYPGGAVTAKQTMKYSQEKISSQ